MKKKFYSLVALFLTATASLQAQTPELELVQFSSGFNNPIGIFNAGDSRLFVVEQTGKIILLSDQGVRNPIPFLDISSQISSGGERGLLGLAFHPDYATNGFFFINYTNTTGSTVISRYQVSSNPDLGDASSEQILLTIPQPYSNHNGGNIAFGHDGYLYIGMGDGGSGGDPQNYAQNRQSLLGKMLRIDVNTVPYSIPANNPFASDLTTLDEIWSIGLRNPWRFSFDKITGDMWMGDVGQNSWEEINFEPAHTGGLNYGWRCYEADNVFNTTGCPPQSAMTFPVSSYENNSTNGCSVTGGFVYRGGKFGNLFGHYLFTDYCSGKFRSVSPDGSGGFVTTPLQQFLQFQYASLGEDRHGELYIAGKGNGNIYKIEETACKPTAFIYGDSICPPLTAVYGEGNSYQWYADGQPIQGATNSDYNPASLNPGQYFVVVTNSEGCADTSNYITVYPTVNPGGGIIGLNQQYNITDNPATLSFEITGGTFSGPGINGNTFNPAIAGPGTHTISYTYTGMCGALQVVTQTVLVVDPAGIPENIYFQNLTLYPNPATDNLTASFWLLQDETITVEIVSMLGQIIYSKTFNLEKGKHQLPISMPSAANGLYILNLTNGKAIRSQRFLLD